MTVQPISATGIRGDLVYSAKFFCGTADGPDSALAQGNYLTTVTIANPNLVRTDFIIEAIETNPLREPRGRVSSLQEERLRPNEGIELDCVDIRRLLRAEGARFLKGTVIIMSPGGDSARRKLDVTAVYTFVGE